MKSKHLPGKEKHTPKRTPLQRARDLADTAALVARGQTETEIAKALNSQRDYSLSRQQIGYDIRELKENWKREAFEMIDTAVGEQVQQYKMLFRENMRGWDGSQKEKTKLEQETVKAEDAEPGKAPGNGTAKEPPKPKQRTRITKEERDGNPAFLQGAKDCLKEIAALLGISAPIKLTGADGGPIPLDLGLENLFDLEHVRNLYDDIVAGKGGNGSVAPAAHTGQPEGTRAPA